MKLRKIYFRADASAEIGYGHFIRSLALADMLKDNFECVFFTTSPTTYMEQEMNKVCSFVTLAPNDKFNDFLNYLKGDEIVVLDNYFFTPEYQQSIKSKGCKLVFIGGDYADKLYVADIVISQFFSGKEQLNINKGTKVLCGLDWAMLRKPFLKADLSLKTSNHWLINFGGTDYLNMTEKFLLMLLKDATPKSITVVIGDAYKYAGNLSMYNDVVIKKDLSAEQMAEEMSKAEYAIVPCSGVSMEALACGCKVASGYFVDNQIYSSTTWGQLGYIYNVGDMRTDISPDFINVLKTFKCRADSDFSSIPARYIDLFSSL